MIFPPLAAVFTVIDFNFFPASLLHLICSYPSFPPFHASALFAFPSSPALSLLSLHFSPLGHNQSWFAWPERIQHTVTAQTEHVQFVQNPENPKF